jgi:hypothetical protein
LPEQNQTNKNFTVYIGNDASAENHEIVLKQFETCLKFIYKKFDSNLGGVSLTSQWHLCVDDAARRMGFNFKVEK